MKPVEPILVVDLFPEERAQLLTLLSRLSAEAWNRPTACPAWSVKDVVQHLLADDIGLLSRRTDFKFEPIEGIENWAGLIAFINRHNELWVQATQRIKPDLLVELLEFTGQKVYQRLGSLDLFALGEPVTWAGPDPAPVWLDVAREYTERWLHQQHIRDAVAKPGLKDRHFLGPVLDTFVRALPHTYRAVEAHQGSSVKLVISGEAGGAWLLVREDEQWHLYQTQPINCNTVVTMDQETAWRLFTKGISKEEVEHNASFEGDRSLGLPILQTVSIIA